MQKYSSVEVPVSFVGASVCVRVCLHLCACMPCVGEGQCVCVCVRVHMCVCTCVYAHVSVCDEISGKPCMGVGVVIGVVSYRGHLS